MQLRDIPDPGWTQLDIVARMGPRLDMDPLRSECDMYIRHLGYGFAKSFLRHERWDNESWPKLALNREQLFQNMQAYHGHAWLVANESRAVGATRSVAKYIAWTWLIGDVEFSENLTRMRDGYYRYYGKPCLRLIGDRYEWPWQEFDDGFWREPDQVTVSPDDGMAKVMAEAIGVKL